LHSRSLGQNFVEMSKSKEYLIPFIGLKLGKHHFEYQISNAFFEIFDYDEYEFRHQSKCSFRRKTRCSN
jgi:hypothetical protein